MYVLLAEERGPRCPGDGFGRAATVTTCPTSGPGSVEIKFLSFSAEAVERGARQSVLRGVEA